MTDYETVERIARQMCEEAGRNFDAKGCKRTHWRKKAARIVALRWDNPRQVIDTLLRACGWRV